MRANPKELKKFVQSLPSRARWGTRYWLYAIGYDNGITKIGMTGNPGARLAHHAMTATSRIVWFHLGGALRFNVLMRSAEVAALRACSKCGERIGSSELFRSLSKSDAIACLRLGVEKELETNGKWLATSCEIY